MALYCELWINAIGRISGRSLGKTSKKSSFCKSKILNVFAEILLAGGLDAIGSAAVRDLIKIHRENGIFVKDQLGVDGEDDLFDLSNEGSFFGEKGVFYKLLGNSGTSFQMFGGEIAFKGPGNTGE